MYDDNYEGIPAHRRAVSSGETSLDGSNDERTLSDTEVSRVKKTKELASQVKGPSSDALEAECEKERIQATKDEITEEKTDEYITVDEEGFEDILGSGDLWKKTIKEGKGKRGSPSQWAHVKVTDLSDAYNEVIDIKFPLGYHYVQDAWELAVQMMLPGEVCLMKCSPRFVTGGESKEIKHKFKIELVHLEGFVDFDRMTEEESITFLKTLKDRSSFYFLQNMVEHALQLNVKALEIISKDLEDSPSFNTIKLQLLIDAAHYYLTIKETSEGLRVVREGLAIDKDNDKLKYKQSQFHFLRKEYKESAIILKSLVAKGIKNSAIQNDLQESETCVKEQLEKEKQVYKRMLGALGKPPKKDRHPKPNVLSPTRKYLLLAVVVVAFAIVFQFVRHIFNIHYF